MKPTIRSLLPPFANEVRHDSCDSFFEKRIKHRATELFCDVGTHNTQFVEEDLAEAQITFHRLCVVCLMNLVEELVVGHRHDPVSIISKISCRGAM